MGGSVSSVVDCAGFPMHPCAITLQNRIIPRVLLFFSSGSLQIQLYVPYKFISVYNMTKVKLKQLIHVVAGSQSVGLSWWKVGWYDMFLWCDTIFAHHAATTVVVTSKGGHQK